MNHSPNIAMGAWAWGNDGTFGSNYTAADSKAVYGAAMKNGLNLWNGNLREYSWRADKGYAKRGIGTFHKIHASD